MYGWTTNHNHYINMHMQNPLYYRGEAITLGTHFTAGPGLDHDKLSGQWINGGTEGLHKDAIIRAYDNREPTSSFWACTDKYTEVFFNSPKHFSVKMRTENT